MDAVQNTPWKYLDKDILDITDGLDGRERNDYSKDRIRSVSK